MLDSLPQGRELEVTPPDGVRSSDYHLIEEAVMDTARGRWFLREYARRIRAAETAHVLEALERIETSFAAAKSQPERPDNSAEIVPQTDRVKTVLPAGVEDLQEVHEKLLDIVWHMRERGFDGQLCTAIRREAGKLAGLIEQKSAQIENSNEPPLLPQTQSFASQPPQIEPDLNGAAMQETESQDQSQLMRDSMVRLEQAAVQADAHNDQRNEMLVPQCDEPKSGSPSLADIDALGTRERLALFS